MLSYAEPAPAEAMDDCQRVAMALSDPDAFAALYDEYYPRIFRFVMRTVMNVDLAEDLTSETFMKAMRSLKTFDAVSGHFSSWLYRIASNTMTDHFRKHSREVLVPDENENFDRLLERGTLGSDPVDARRRLDALREHQALHQAISQLKPEFRLPIVLHYFEEKPYKEITGILRCTMTTLKWRMFQARRQLAMLLNSEQKDSER
ncbi:sigma-70 family RNA polymerase sigma factor [Candidatus Sumerlaeota bacterium]|nr:sigma-70 family RNA polymerase sigma factor [Candidatus Sumerlaeota bacterium]